MLRQRVSDRRTQVYFPDDLYSLVRMKAKERNISMAEIIREAVISHTEEGSTDESENDLMEVSGIFSGGPKDVSLNTAKYLKEMYKNKRL